MKNSCMTTLPKSLSGAAFMLLATLLFLSPADAFAAKRGTSVRTKRIKLLQEALVLTKAGETQLTGDRLKATLEIQQALAALEAAPAPTPKVPPTPPANLAALHQSLEKGKADLTAALDTMSQKDIAVANPVIGAINHLDKAIFLVELQERAAAAQAVAPAPPATPAPTPAPDTNAASSPAGGDQVQPVQPQQENSGQTQPGQPAASTTPAPTNAP
jgi:hypothetical protein